MSSSWSAGSPKEQLPSGLRGKSPWPLTVPAELPVAAAKLPGAAGDFAGLLQRHCEQAVVRVGGERAAHGRADEVHGAAGEDEIVPADVAGVGGQARDLDDPARHR